ncbi:MAG: cysteine synthase family protein, partial [Clostridia bacterium]|nr:cysteine synthase family protein [Clostridia bacterium]
EKGMQGAIEKAEELHANLPGSIIAGQFVNPANPEAHYQTTGPEIWADTEGKIDILVCTVGTGGTLSGTAKYLKEKNPAIQVIAVEPLSSPLLSQGKCGAHKIQGIGANFIPKTLDQTAYDKVIAVSDEDAFYTAAKAAKTDGAFVGISSGAALYAAIQIAKCEHGKTVVVLCPDGGSRYLSTPDFID